MCSLIFPSILLDESCNVRSAPVNERTVARARGWNLNMGYYMESMAKAGPTTTERIVRDAKSGRFVTVRGLGALKGRLTIREDVDLTKPIASQVE